MKVLAIESSGLVASVAIVDEEQMLAEYTINYKKTHSQTLLPMLEDMVKITGIELEEIDYIAVSAGPGSFTGLRIGAATAKGLGLALNKKLIHVPTVDGLAYQFFESSKLICPIMDARRSQVYTGLYLYEKEFEVIKEQTVVPIKEIIEKINEAGRAVVFLGDGVPVYKEQIKENIKVEYSFAPGFMNRQRAAVIGALGMEYAKAGRVVEADEFSPEYLRVSQAERERAEKLAGK